MVLGSRGKYLCICVLCVMLLHCLFFVFNNSYASNFVRGENLHLVSKKLWLQGDTFVAEGFFSGLW